MDFLAWALAFSILVITMHYVLDLWAHVSRYIHHINLYPASRSRRGEVWRITK